MSTSTSTSPSARTSPVRDFLTTPVHSEDRWLGALALVVTAATHIPLIKMHLEEAPYIGWLFILLSAASLALALLILIADSKAVWLTGGVVAFAAVLAFFASRTSGLPQISDDIGNWTEALSYPAVAAEAIAAAVAYVALRPRVQSNRRRETTLGSRQR